MSNTWLIVPALALAFVTCLVSTFSSQKPKVVFDLPDRIECRDVTPENFAARTTHKVIEARFRISSRFVTGAEADIVDFLYIIASSAHPLRIQDYLPNTTLESTVTGDQIEVTDKTEVNGTQNADMHVGYKILKLGITQTKGTNESESSQYKQIAQKALVVSSGTVDREHGVFFKLRPSKLVSLEGAKDFTFLAIVPRSWRGDWCTISCAARTNRRFMMTESIVPAGVEQAQVGLYLAGDLQAAKLVDQLRVVQDAYGDVLYHQLVSNRDSFLKTMYSAIKPQAQSNCSVALCGVYKCSGHANEISPTELTSIKDAEKAVIDAQVRLRRLAE